LNGDNEIWKKPIMSEDQSQDYSIVGYALEGLDSLAAKDEAIRLLQEERKQLKAEIIEELTRILGEIPLAQAFDVASDAYWADSQLADIVKKSYVAATRRGLCPRPTPVNFSCRRCGNLVTAVSWTEYNSILSLEERRQNSTDYSWLLPTCHSCREIESAESYEQHQADSKAYRERWMAEEEERKRAMEILRTISFAEYIKTEHWQLLRQAALKHAGYRCQLCNARGILNVHLRADENRGRESLNDVVVMCENCHGAFQLIQEVRTL